MSRNTKVLYILALVRLILPFFLQDSYYQLHRDEYLYIAEGQHLATGFMEVPPMLSIMSFISNLFGHHPLLIKVWPALFGSLTFILIGKIILSLGGKAFALFLGWLPFVIGGYVRLFFLFHPNFLDVFFWTAMSFAIIRYIQTAENKWFYFFGLGFGLGMMSKYSVAFFAVSLMAGILLTPHRKIFLNKHFYYATLVGLLIFLPNIIWQYMHRFPVIHHMKELQEEQLQYNDTKDFVIAQLMTNLAFIFIWIGGLIFVSFSRQGKPYRLFCWAYVFVIALLIILRGKSYYASGTYPVLFAFGAFYFEQATQLKWKWVRYPLIGFTLLLGLYSMPLIMPLAKLDTLINYYEKSHLNKTGSFKWEDQKMHPLPQDFADMIGWKEMAAKAGVIYNNLPPAEKSVTAVFCTTYYAAGALTYYRAENDLPAIWSDDASFLWWLPSKPFFRNMLLICHTIPANDDPFYREFRKMTLVDSMNMPLFREHGMKFVLLENGSDSVATIFNDEIMKMKSQFTR